jgi:hypothetical protein
MAIICGMGLSIALLLIEQSSYYTYKISGNHFPLIDTYGKVNVKVEEEIVLNSELVEDKSKLLIQEQRSRIAQLETELNHLKRGTRVRNVFDDHSFSLANFQSKASMMLR